METLPFDCNVVTFKCYLAKNHEGEKESLSLKFLDFLQNESRQYPSLTFSE